MTPLETLFEFYGPTLYKEGTRWVRLQGLSATLRSLKGARRAALALFAAFVSSMILTAAVFSCLLHELWSIESKGRFQFDAFFWTCAVLAAVTLSVIIWNLSEKRWMSISGLSLQFEKEMKQPKHLELVTSHSKKANT